MIDPDLIPMICDDPNAPAKQDGKKPPAPKQRQKQDETQVCEEWEDCPEEETMDKENCYPDPEFAKDIMVTNMWETGQIWGDILANMFQNTIESA